MPLAALYDIHGNLPALEAVLRDVRAAGVDRIVVGGDVLPGPMPRACLDSLMSIDIPATFIRGNGELAVLAEREGRDSGVPPQYRAMMKWVGAELTPADVHAIAGWPMTARIGDILFCHATPRSENEIFVRTTAEETLAPIFESAGAPTIVCGHTHMQFDRRIGRVRVLNAGSVGMPFGPPGAYWLLLGTDAEFRRTDYDLAAAAERVCATAYPGAAEFASRNVLEPPSDDQMLALFARSELRPNRERP
jgi:predicted phosphodiesterase